MCILAAVHVLTCPVTYQLAARFPNPPSSYCSQGSTFATLQEALRLKLVAAVEAAVIVARKVSVVDSLGLRGGFLRRGRSKDELPPEEGRRTAVEKADIAGSSLELVSHIHAQVSEFFRTHNTLLDAGIAAALAALHCLPSPPLGGGGTD